MNKRIGNKRKAYLLLFDDNGLRMSVYVVAKSVEAGIKMIIEVYSSQFSPIFKSSFRLKAKNKWSGFISPRRKSIVYKWVMSYNKVGFINCTQVYSLSICQLLNMLFETYTSRVDKINTILKY